MSVLIPQQLLVECFLLVTLVQDKLWLILEYFYVSED